MQQEPTTHVSVEGNKAAPTVPAPVKLVANPRSPLGTRVPLHILAADDVRINRELLRQLTAYFGYKAEIVENGAEAIAALSRNPFDLVLLDVQMPVMDGLEAAREIVRLQPDPGLRPKIVALTASSESADQAACLAAGMDDCLPKPLSPRAFEACVIRLFAGASPAPRPAPLPIRPAQLLPPALVDLKEMETALPGVTGARMLAIQRRMYGALTKDFEATWPKLVDAVAHQDQARLATALHALKGCFSVLGWKRIASRCGEALQSARARQFAEWSTFPAELQQLYAASTEEMTRHLAKVAPDDSPQPSARDKSDE
jgi:CheY-like chemotaxis protein